jgi:sarcosine oxidase
LSEDQPVGARDNDSSADEDGRVQTYSHIVIGAGAVGSATAYWLAQHGAERVLVLDRFGLINDRGSSGDHSRIIRHAYHREDYVRLTVPMFETWRHVEEHSGLPLYLRTGGLDLAPAGGPGLAELRSYQAAMDAVGIPYDQLTAADVRDRFPQWRVEDDTVGLWQEAGGLLDIRRSVSAHTSLALAAGTEFRAPERVTGIRVGGRDVAVRTDRDEYSAGHLVVAAGSWLGDLMADLGLSYRLTLAQEQVAYFTTPHLADFAPDRHPIWIHHDDEVFYGFPVYGEAGVKLARDMRGRFVSSEQRSYEPDPEESEVLRGFLRRHLPRAAGPLLVAKTCVYDMPSDRDFVLDTVPGHPHVAVFNGAGHAGKFSSLVGRILAELTTDGVTRHDISAFSLARPAITDPDFEPIFRLTG